MSDKNFECVCTCGGFTLSYDKEDKLLELDFYTKDFYNYQGLFSSIKQWLRLIINNITGKRYLSDIVLTEENILELKNYLESLELKDNKTKNYGRCVVEHSKEDEEYYYFYLKSMLSLKDILKGHGHRAYSITLGKRECYQLLRSIRLSLLNR